MFILRTDTCQTFKNANLNKIHDYVLEIEAKEAMIYNEVS